MEIYILFRFSKKTGKIDTTMTGIGNALMQIWALQNTTATKNTIIVERNTGKVIFTASGKKNGIPEVKKGDLGIIEEYGINLNDIRQIKDDRFDKAGE